MSGFLEASGVVFESEGGLSDHPWDKGGRTQFGIIADTWKRWLAATGQAQRPIDTITKDEARAIYHKWYWLAGKCDALPWPLSLVHFDSMVQHAEAPRLLQRALRVKEDGLIGPATIAAALPARAQLLAEELIWTRLLYYRDLLDYRELQKGQPGNYSFIRGWITRMHELRNIVLGKKGAQ